MNTLYTIGYQGHTLASLVAAVRERKAVLCDVRYRAWSHNPDWRPDSLRGQLGVSYWPCPELGNVNYNNGGDIQLARPEAVLESMRSTLKRHPVVLMCGCRDHATCHRTVAAEWLAQRIGCLVEHLAPAEREVVAGVGIPTLTLNQPWATLVAAGYKRIETRSWSTSYRGPIAIHAASGLGPVGGKRGLLRLGTSPHFAPALIAAGYRNPADLPRGAVLALAELVDCCPTGTTTEGSEAYRQQDGTMRAIWGMERVFGDYTPGRFAWLLANVRALPEAIPAKGALGLWRWVSPETEEVTG